MGAITLECSECFRVVSVSTSGQKCVCGSEFIVSNPAVFENPFFENLGDDKSAHILVTTENHIEEVKVLDRLGIVSAEYVAGVNALREAFFVGFTDTFGGRSSTLQSELRIMKDSCIQALKSQAFDLGANAVIAVDFKYANLSGNNRFMMMLVATGTAVKLQPVDGETP